MKTEENAGTNGEEVEVETVNVIDPEIVTGQGQEADPETDADHEVAHVTGIEEGGDRVHALAAGTEIEGEIETGGTEIGKGRGREEPTPLQLEPQPGTVSIRINIARIHFCNWCSHGHCAVKSYVKWDYPVYQRTVRI